MKPLPRVRTGLLQHKLDEQVLVYDPCGDRVHLLDPTTACVLTLLEEGGWTREGIAAELTRRLGVTPSGSLLPLALEELRAADLFDSSAEAPTPLVDVTRRDLLRKAAMTGAAALLIPAIVTFTATPGYAQASGAGALGLCALCTSTAQCASSRTCDSSAKGGACGGAGKFPNGATCLNNGECCSNKCTGAPSKTCQP